MVDFIKEAETIQQQVVLWRRDLHQCPELLLDLPKTSAYVERELQKMGYETERICQSGLTTVLDSGKPGKTLLLRADMNALPIQEESELPATVNDDTVGEEMFGYVKELLGKEQTKILPPIMGSEDFGEVLKEVPGVFFRISLGDKQEGYPYISHNAKVIFNEDGMKNAVAAFAYCAVKWLNAHQTM